MERRIETPLGKVRVTAYREGKSYPNRQVLVVVVQDLHSSNVDPDAEPVVVNKIPVRFTEWFEAELTADLSQESSWRWKSSTVTRKDGNGYNDATANQQSKVWRACRDALTGLFTDPNFIFEIVLADQWSVVEQKRKAVEAAENALTAARAELDADVAVAEAMELSIDSEGDERKRVFGLTSVVV